MRVFSPTSSKRLNEVTGFVFLAAGILLLLSLVSYHPQDPSWNTATGHVRTINLAGPFGAHLADLFLQGFGAAAFLFPFLAFAAGWKWIRSEIIETPIIRLTGFLLFLSCSSAAVSLFHSALIYDHLIPVGGAVGLLLADKLRESLNDTGSIVVALTGMIISVYLFSAFTLDKLSHWFAPLIGIFRQMATDWRRWREDRRERALERQEAKREAREAAQQRAAEARQAAAATAAAAAASPATTSERPSRRKKSDPQAEIEFPTTATIDELPWETSSGRTSQQPAAPDEPGEIPICVLEEQPPPPPVGGVMPPFAAPEPHRRPPEPVRNQTVYKLPATDFLNEAPGRTTFDEQELKNTAAAIKAKFEEFSVMGSVVQINPGPVVTTFEFKPDAGVKYSRIIALREDLCLGLQAESILIERIPGKMTVGVEVPNTRREVIALRQIFESEEFQNSQSRLTISMGKDINGRIKVATLDTMPHVLIAGSTGSGKSVMINSLVMSILYKSTPDEVRMIMVDPKRVELGMYEGIPHLLTPVITDPRKATNALKNAVLEMERRLRLLAEHGARNIEQFNKKVRKLQEQPRNLFEEESPTATEELRPLPFILILIDELADLMMLEGKNVEESVTRLAQMARAVGMHLVLATQRPSVDVITGLIKANFPARISFRVATRVDSRTILDSMGAEHLLGKGDMLYLPPGSSRLTRVHGAFVTESEINEVVDFWKKQASPEYDQSYLIAPPSEDGEPSDIEPESGEQDPMYEEAMRVVLEMGKASTSTLQRRLRLGYGRAARILDMMYRDGIIGPPDGSKPREVLKRPDWLKEVDRV
ncbi:MAG TPA: DNA translocase FtsK [Bryobacteraceae bacterium]|jgi:S-DNA-T family DNA segregation ATPase FtsK/SpoIIIE